MLLRLLVVAVVSLALVVVEGLTSRSPPFFDNNVKAPTWEELHRQLLSTEIGQQLDEETKLRDLGFGKPHIDNRLRLFISSDDPTSSSSSSSTTTTTINSSDDDDNKIVPITLY